MCWRATFFVVVITRSNEPKLIFPSFPRASMTRRPWGMIYGCIFIFTILLVKCPPFKACCLGAFHHPLPHLHLVPPPPPECRRSRSGSHKLWKWVKKIAREWRRSKKIIAHMLILFRRRFRKKKKALHAYTLTLPGLVLGEPEQRRVMICLSALRRHHDGHALPADARTENRTPVLMRI